MGKPRLRPWSFHPPHPLRERLSRALGVHPATAQVLAVRGYGEPADAESFLRAPLDALSSPRQLPDLLEAARVIWRAARGGQPVTVYGDFDADGVCAVAILVRGLRSLGVEPGVYIPHRLQEGYGLNAPAVRALAESGTRGLVTVDCGVGSVAEVALAKELGMEVVVVDHHEPPPVLPPADVVVDPKIPDRPYRFRGYCAAGLAWLLVAALRQLAGAPVTEDLLELAAVGTVADLVPLVDDNRILVRHGLRRLAESPVLGLRVLSQTSGLTGPVRADDVAWRLAPRLNAAGRVDTAQAALRLLLTDDPQEAQDLAAWLERQNAHRQRLHEQALGEAVTAVEQEGLSERPAIVVWGEGWHPGVVGLVAGRLRETYWRPAIALAVGGEMARGSVRGLPGLDLVELLRDCAHLVDRFGGHASAAGLSLPVQNLQEFRRRFEEAVGSRITPELLVPGVAVEAEVELREVTERLVDELAMLEPFGAGNPKPVLAARSLVLLEVGCWAEGEHLWLKVWDGGCVHEAVGFGLGEWGELLAFAQASLDIAGFPERDRWQEGGIRWVLEDLRTPGLQPDRILAHTPSLLRRLMERAEDYLGGAYRSVEVRPVLFTKVAGVTFEGRQEVVAQLSVGEEVLLRRQPDNPADPHAVQVVRKDGAVVGYLSSPLAGRVAPQLDRGARYRATVVAVTGGGEKNLGANLRLEQEAPPSRAVWVRSAFAASWDAQAATRAVVGGDGLDEEAHSVLPRLLRGQRVAVAGAPRPGWFRLPLAAAAAWALRDRRVVYVTPLAELTEGRWQAWKSSIERLGLRGAQLHGLVGRRELAQAEEALEAGAVDVVFTTPAYLAQRPELVSSDSLVVADGWVTPELPEPFGDHQGPFLWCLWDPTVRPEGWELHGPQASRTGVRVVDRRAQQRRPVEEWLAQGPVVLFAAGPRSAVEIARRGEFSGQVAYDHPGLPALVRETLVQLFNQGKLSALVCGGPAPEGLRARTLVWLAPTAQEVFLQQAGSHPRDQVTLVLDYDREGLHDTRREWESHHPSRRSLVALYRLLQTWPGELRWPDPDLGAAVREATGLDAALAVPSALHVLETAGLVSRERVPGGWRLQLCPVEDRRDLGSVLRFVEGEHSRAAFEAGSVWMLGCSAVEMLRRVAAGSLAARPESGAG